FACLTVFSNRTPGRFRAASTPTSSAATLLVRNFEFFHASPNQMRPVYVRGADKDENPVWVGSRIPHHPFRSLSNIPTLIHHIDVLSIEIFKEICFFSYFPCKSLPLWRLRRSFRAYAVSFFV